ncbi:MAG TPA: hypothetical protein ENN99_13420 [Chloroflexi bacterium]|nr:hypothetical protein [Chloroflexota bacterium]
METPNPVIYLFLAVGCLSGAAGIVVWIIGYFRGRGQGENARQDSERAPAPNLELERGRASSPPVEAASETLSPTTPSASSERQLAPDEQELLRVVRTVEGKPVVLVRGNRYDRLQDIKDALAERDAAEAVHALLAFAEGWLPALKHIPSQAPPPSAETEEMFLKMLREADLFASGRKPSLLSGGGSVLTAMDQSFQDLVTSPGSRLVAPAEQINSLVQQRLQDRPDLRKHGIIRISTSMDGSLRFHVGLKSFDAVDDITDPQVRALIADAIQEWSED